MNEHRRPIPDVERLQTPALVVRLDVVRRNVTRTIEATGRVERWRPHVKTVKIPAVMRELLDAGVRRFKCATTREAAVLLATADEAGIEIDLLVAMALRGENLERIAALGALHDRARLSLLTEDPAHAETVRRTAPRLGLYVDLDPGFGRSGIPPYDVARREATLDAAGDALRGLHQYEGHVRHTDPAARRAAVEPLFTRLVELATITGVRELVTSGTPTFLDALAFEPFAGFDHQVSPGTVVYWDTTSESFGIEGYEPAATVLARVIARTGPRRATLDAGSKAIDAASGSPCAVVVGRPDLIARRPSEEHLPLAALGALDAPRAGELLELVPRHVCPTVDLAGEAWLVDGTAARRVEVTARGHEL